MTTFFSASTSAIWKRKRLTPRFAGPVPDLPRLYDANIDVVACDMHPDYLSTKHSDDIAGKAGSPLPAVTARSAIT